MFRQFLTKSVPKFIIEVVTVAACKQEKLNLSLDTLSHPIMGLAFVQNVETTFPQTAVLSRLISTIIRGPLFSLTVVK